MRAALTASDNGTPGLVLLDEHKKLRAGLRLDTDGVPYLAAVDDALSADLETNDDDPDVEETEASLASPWQRLGPSLTHTHSTVAQGNAVEE